MRPALVDKNSGLAAQLTPINCPCCNQFVPVPSLEIIIDRYKVSPLDARILTVIWKARGMPVSTERIFDAMYATDPTGGPSSGAMYSSFKQALFSLRNRLAGSGVSITNAGYRQGYRLTLGDKN